MWTGFAAVLLHPEADDRALLLAVLRVAGDAERLPEVATGAVEPEAGVVVEGRLVDEHAVLLLGAADRLLGADDAGLVLLLGAADVDPDLARAADLHPELGRLADGDRGPGLRGERLDAVLRRRRGGSGRGEREGDDERERPCDAMGD